MREPAPGELVEGTSALDEDVRTEVQRRLCPLVGRHGRERLVERGDRLDAADEQRQAVLECEVLPLSYIRLRALPEPRPPRADTKRRRVAQETAKPGGGLGAAVRRTDRVGVDSGATSLRIAPHLRPAQAQILHARSAKHERVGPDLGAVERELGLDQAEPRFVPLRDHLAFLVHDDEDAVARRAVERDAQRLKPNRGAPFDGVAEKTDNANLGHGVLLVGVLCSPYTKQPRQSK